MSGASLYEVHSVREELEDGSERLSGSFGAAWKSQNKRTPSYSSQGTGKRCKVRLFNSPQPHELREPGNFPLQKRVNCFRSYIAGPQTGSARSNDEVDLSIVR